MLVEHRERHAKHDPGSRNYQRYVVKIWWKQAKDRTAAEATAKAAAESAAAEGQAEADGGDE